MVFEAGTDVTGFTTCFTKALSVKAKMIPPREVVFHVDINYTVVFTDYQHAAEVLFKLALESTGNEIEERS